MTEITNWLVEKWYIPAAGVLAVWFAVTVYEQYPSQSGIGKSAGFSIHASDSLLRVYRQIKHRQQSAGLNDPATAGQDLFKPVQARKRPSATAGSKKRELPPRNFRLMGISNNRSAIIENAQGISLVVVPGDSIDSAVVKRIKSDRIVLKDRGGIFEIIIKD